MTLGDTCRAVKHACTWLLLLLLFISLTTGTRASTTTWPDIFGRGAKWW